MSARQYLKNQLPVVLIHLLGMLALALFLIASGNPVQRENLGFIFQDFNLLDTLTISENIALALAINKTPAKEVEPMVHEIASKLNISFHFQPLLPAGHRQGIQFRNAQRPNESGNLRRYFATSVSDTVCEQL